MIFQKEEYIFIKIKMQISVYLTCLLERHENFEKKENTNWTFVLLCHIKLADIIAEKLFVTKWRGLVKQLLHRTLYLFL